MKKNKATVYLFLALLCVWCPIFVGFRYSQQIRNILPAVFVQVWDKAKPAASTSLRNSNPEMLANQAALESAIGQDHEFSTGGTNSGKHEVLTMEEESSAGASSTDEGHLQVIDGGSQPEMAFTSEDGDELQFTKDGDLFSSDGLVVTEASTFNGSITLGAGDDLIGSATSGITFNTNKFTVAGATGNTVMAGTASVGGTLGVTGETTLTGGLAATTMSGALAMGSKEITGLDAGDASGDAVHFGQWKYNNVAAAVASGSAGDQGSITLPNGLIIKFGEESVATDTTDDVSYTTAFPNAFLWASCAFQGTGVSIGHDCAVQPKSGSETSILQVTNGHSTSTIYWMAIGR